jgi:glutamate synthase (NADPH/NADH) small chain
VQQEMWPADLVILAVGFMGVRTEDSASQKIGSIKNSIDWMHLLNEKGVLETNESYQTMDPQIYAAGDSRRGASLIVWAIHEGRQMAHAMMMSDKRS